MLNPGKTYEDVCSAFRWKIPQLYNIGVDICDKWANERYRLALIYEDDEGKIEKYTFWDLKGLSNRLANLLKAYGVEKGDRVAFVLPQSPEVAISHIATYKLGAIAVPLLTLFGPEALEYRLKNSEAKVVITNGENIEKVLDIKDKLPHLETLIVAKGESSDALVDFWGSLEKGSREFEPVMTTPDDPALIIYTSGTTGPPKGALHAHRVLLGHLPGIEFFHNFFPRRDDIQWTPADWAWIAGLFDVLLTSWHHGVPVLAHRMRKFDPEKVFDLISRHGIRNAFMPPTALKVMRKVEKPHERYEYDMRTIVCGGETLGKELLSWGKEVFGLTLHEIYGQTEVHLVAGNCSEVMEVRPGSLGRTCPGHELEVVDDKGNVLSPGEIGELAVRRPDPVMFLGYWRNPEATKEKFIGDWFLTGDLAKKDEDGYIWFSAREDDMIKSSGYRIGPSEIEDCILKHPSVSLVGVVGSPDKSKGTIVKAFIVLRKGIVPDDSLKEEIQDFVKSRLAAYEYPREIDFVDKLPMTESGKIKRKELRDLEIQRKLGPKS